MRSSAPNWRTGSPSRRRTRCSSHLGPTQLDLDDDTCLSPDIVVHPRAIRTPDVRGGDALLVVEVADSGLPYDMSTKAPLYAAHGVREYWVVNAGTLATMVHRQPAGRTWGSVTEVPTAVTLTPSLVPALSVSLAALDLQPG